MYLGPTRVRNGGGAGGAGLSMTMGLSLDPRLPMTMGLSLDPRLGGLARAGAGGGGLGTYTGQIGLGGWLGGGLPLGLGLGFWVRRRSHWSSWRLAFAFHSLFNLRVSQVDFRPRAVRFRSLIKKKGLQRNTKTVWLLINLGFELALKVLDPRGSWSLLHWH